MYVCMYKKDAKNFSYRVTELCVFTSYRNSGKTQKATSIYYIHTVRLLKHDSKSLQLFKHLL